MKKLILSATILLGSLSTFAQATPEETTTTTTTEVKTTEEYAEIKLDEVPTAVTESLKKSVPDAKLVKAFINEKKQYKLEVEIGDKVGSLYADAKGKWIN